MSYDRAYCNDKYLCHVFHFNKGFVDIERLRYINNLHPIKPRIVIKLDNSLKCPSCKEAILIYCSRKGKGYLRTKQYSIHGGNCIHDPKHPAFSRHSIKKQSYTKSEQIPDYKIEQKVNEIKSKFLNHNSHKHKTKINSGTSSKFKGKHKDKQSHKNKRKTEKDIRSLSFHYSFEHIENKTICVIHGEITNPFKIYKNCKLSNGDIGTQIIFKTPGDEQHNPSIIKHKNIIKHDSNNAQGTKIIPIFKGEVLFIAFCQIVFNHESGDRPYLDIIPKDNRHVPSYYIVHDKK